MLDDVLAIELFVVSDATYSSCPNLFNSLELSSIHVYISTSVVY